MEIKYLKGDATKPIAEGNKIIVHVCNDMGGWGRGFVLALSKQWKEPEIQYRAWAKSGENFKLGEVQFVQVEPTLWIANLIGQHDIHIGKDGTPPVRYHSIRLGLTKVSVFARELNASVHMPRIGCGLAGGTWDQIEPSISHELTAMGVETFVYDLE
ncbi:MAG: macro domain-containing protein [Cyclobacteriaceae bacterium]|nr:macro domain-containing protein [Cyclobacteriaceae bacterium]